MLPCAKFFQAQDEYREAQNEAFNEELLKERDAMVTRVQAAKNAFQQADDDDRDAQSLNQEKQKAWTDHKKETRTLETERKTLDDRILARRPLTRDAGKQTQKTENDLTQEKRRRIKLWFNQRDLSDLEDKLKTCRDAETELKDAAERDEQTLQRVETRLHELVDNQAALEMAALNAARHAASTKNTRAAAQGHLDEQKMLAHRFYGAPDAGGKHTDFYNFDMIRRALGPDMTCAQTLLECEERREKRERLAQERRPRMKIGISL